MDYKKGCRRYCSVPECGKRSGRMFWFPKDALVRRLWKDTCKISRPITDTMNICEEHFKDEDMKITAKGRNRIVKGAVPTLKLPAAPVQKKSGRRCAVPRCENTSNSAVTFHRFPKNYERRMAWSVACKLIKPPRKDTRICSAHFSESDFYPVGNVKCLKKSHIVPSVNLPETDDVEERLDDSDTPGSPVHVSCILTDTESELSDESRTGSSFENRVSTVDTPVEFYNQLDNHHHTIESHSKPTAKRLLNEIPSTFSIEQERELSVCVRDQLISFVSHSTASCQTDSSSDLVNSAEQTDELQCHSKMTVLDLLKRDSDLITFTGVSHSVLNCLCLLVQKCTDCINSKVPLKLRIALTLCRLRLNLSFSCLGLLFGVDLYSCGSSFATTIQQLAAILRCSIYLPSKEENLKSMPKCFNKFMDTRIVLYCLEVPVDSSECLKCRIRMFSHYEGRLTIKILVGVAPSGLVSFLSRVYGGRASDKKIFKESDLIKRSMLERHVDAVMIDKGFRIDDVCAENGIKIYRVPFVVKREQLNKASACHSADIACAQVHVERVIQRMKEFKILQDKLSYCTMPHIDDIVTVIGGLVNLSYPVLSCGKIPYRK